MVAKAKSKRVTLQQVIDQEAVAEADFAPIGGGKIDVYYNPTKITRRMVEDQREHTTEDAEEDLDIWWLLADTLQNIVVRWDLYLDDDAEDPIPVELDALKDVPVPVLFHIRQAIFEHYVPKYLTGPIMPAISEQTENSEVSQNGTTSSS